MVKFRVTFTLVYSSQPPSILIEICNQDSIEYIINEQQKTFMLANDLCVGKFYEFLNLETVTIQLKVTMLSLCNNVSLDEKLSNCNILLFFADKSFKMLQVYY